MLVLTAVVCREKIFKHTVGEVKMSKSMKSRMHTEELYLPNDEDIVKWQTCCLDMLFQYNSLKPSQISEKKAMLKEMFGDIGANCYIETPFHANFGGAHCHFGNNVYANFNLTLVDDTHIYVGDNTMFGPNVMVITATHPIHPELRQKGYQYNAPVTIGKNCWIGAGAIILPGVTIGNNTVIGAGSIVTKTIPANVVAYGNPCEVARVINEKDRLFYYKDRRIDWDNLV